MLKKLYVKDSLTAENGGGFSFELKNTLATSTIIAPPEVLIDGEPVEVDFVVDGERVPGTEVSEESPFKFEKGMTVEVTSEATIDEGAHKIAIKTATKEWDTLDFSVEDTL